jgi:hypothetical protein
MYSIASISAPALAIASSTCVLPEKTVWESGEFITLRPIRQEI